MRSSIARVSVVKMVAAREHIYVRETQGYYTNWRWACVWITQLVFYGLPWLNWNGRQIVLFDLAAQKFYIFGIVLWPQDLIYLALLLIVCAYAVFLASAIVGRVWCGFACPHTVYTEIFLWIERKIEGTRTARMRLDKEAQSFNKLTKKTFKHGAWAGLAFWTGFTLVGYFTPVRVLLHEAITVTLTSWECLWISCYGFLTYGNAGWMREQVCRYICPHSRFQSAMCGRDTLVVAYDAARGEPRGLRNRKHLVRQQRQGDCVDCTLCLQVCPTGNDIRQGFHYDCMGCAACIDACNLVMDKIGVPRGLIRYAAAGAPTNQLAPSQIRRVLIYAPGLLVAIAAFVGSLMLRTALKLDVIRDRGVMLREVEDGMIENVYRLQIVNTDERPHRYRISVSGIETIALATSSEVDLESTTSRSVPVLVRAAREKCKPGSNEILFEVKDQDDNKLRATEKAAFLTPR